MPDTAAFIDAIKAGEFERVKAMASADPTLIDARSRTGESAILTAVYHRQKEIVNLLVARGAPLDLFEACAAGEIERVERLVDERGTAINDWSGDGWTPLHAALAGNHKLVAALLIGAGADVNAADAQGWRPLHLAAANNNLDVIKALIAQGADVHAANGEAKTALSLAQEKNHREAASFLRRHGA